MRVLLVYSCHGMNLLPAPPVGLSYVATATRQVGHEVRFIDLNLAGEDLSVLRNSMREFRPEVVGISARNIDNVVRQRLDRHLGRLAKEIALIREESASRQPIPTWIVVGGPAISILREAALEHLDVDFAVFGEGERSFPALLAAIAEGAPPDGIPGVCLRREGKIHTATSASQSRFGASGMQNWIDWPAYKGLGATWAIQTKRGCPLPCSYCTYPVIEGRTLRTRPAREVVDEIEDVIRCVAPRTIDFIDSTFNVPPEHAMEICEEIIRRDLRVQMTTMGINPLHASKELFSLMKRAGFNSMMITPESASATMLESLSKGFSVDHVHRAATLALESGLRCIWFFMLGGPGEDRDTVEETLSFVERHLDSSRFLINIFTGVRILPRTALARTAFESGYLEPGTDLSESVFYMSPLVSETWILDRINAAINRRPNIVHAAEEGAPTFTQVIQKALRLAGVSPPYWRFLPHYLRTPLVRAGRKRYPAVGTGARPTASS